MTIKDEMDLDVQTPSEREEELELDETPEAEETADEDNQGNDPLDDIQDPELLRAEAKKQRSIAQRHKKPKEEKKVVEEPPTDEPKKNFLTTKDFEKANQRDAIRLATEVSENDTDEVKAQKEDIKANWQEIRGFYTSRKGQTTVADISEDIKDAYAVFNSRRPKEEVGDNSADELTKTKVEQGTGSKPKPVSTKKEPPRFKLPTKPDEWYP